jgi:hypothetical protein
MLLAVSLQVDNYCEGQRCEVLDRSACPRACQLFVRTSRPTTCKHKKEEDKAGQYGELTAVQR